MFTKAPESVASQLEKIVDYRDDTQDLNHRARSYLYSNCSHCHRKWGGGNAEFTLLANKTLQETATLGVSPAHGEFHLRKPALLIPGSPKRSLLYHRMTMLGLGRMPHVGSHLRDESALQLLEQWIREMPNDTYSNTTGVVSKDAK